MDRPRTRRRPVHRMFCAFERRALGGVMSVVAFVVERRLIKAVDRRGETRAPAPDARRGPGGLTAAADPLWRAPRP